MLSLALQYAKGASILAIAIAAAVKFLPPLIGKKLKLGLDKGLLDISDPQVKAFVLQGLALADSKMAGVGNEKYQALAAAITRKIPALVPVQGELADFLIALAAQVKSDLDQEKSA